MRLDAATLLLRRSLAGMDDETDRKIFSAAATERRSSHRL
jgi:hypothetical protein